jgi:LacI family transcriptional regulator
MHPEAHIFTDCITMGSNHSPGGKRIRLHEVAEAASVSLATVDRVLNKRGRVKQETVRHVLKIAEQLRYVPDQNAQRLRRWANDGPPSFCVALPRGKFSFFKKLWNSFEEYSSRSELGIAIGLHEVKEVSVESTLEFFEKTAPLFNGVAVVGVDHPAVIEAINKYCAEGGKVVCTISDLARSRRHSFVGEDSRAVGKTAAHLLGKFARREKGTIAVLYGQLSQKDHADRLWGFQTVLEADHPGLKLAEVRAHPWDELACQKLVESILKANPDLVGIYGMCAEINGIVAALNASGRKSEIIFIAQELTADSRRHVATGAIDAILDQDTRFIAERTIRTLLDLAEETFTPRQVQQFAPVSIIVRENLPLNDT